MDDVAMLRCKVKLMEAEICELRIQLKNSEFLKNYYSKKSAKLVNDRDQGIKELYEEMSI